MYTDLRSVVMCGIRENEGNLRITVQIDYNVNKIHDIFICSAQGSQL